MCVDEISNGLLELNDTLEDAALQAPPSEFGKKALDDVEPRAAGWREMNVEALVPLEPGFDLRVFMCCVVVHDQMDV